MVPHLLSSLDFGTESYFPSIYKTIIAWQDYRKGNNICMYDLSANNETRITNCSHAFHLAVYGNRIVWEDDRNGNNDIYLYDLSTHQETRITTDESDQRHVQ
jgi:beta propeller repeat protein